MEWRKQLRLGQQEGVTHVPTSEVCFSAEEQKEEEEG